MDSLEYLTHVSIFDKCTPGYRMLLKSVSRGFARSVAEYDESRPRVHVATELYSRKRITLPPSRMNAEEACSSPALLRWVANEASSHVPLPAGWWAFFLGVWAVHSGNIDTLKTALQLGFKAAIDVWMMAAALGRIDMLEVIESHCGLWWKQGDPPPSDRHSSPCEVTTIAAFYGHLEALKWLLGRGCPFDVDMLTGACFLAVSGPHYEVLGYCYTHTTKRPGEDDWTWHESSSPVTDEVYDNLGDRTLRFENISRLLTLSPYNWWPAI